MAPKATGPAAVLPCGACKFMRRRCKPDCVFASSLLTSDYSSEQFGAMHKVFGASNMSKLLSQVPHHLRHDAVTTLLFEAEARIQDPVYGCTARVFALEKQVQILQEELIQVKAQLTKDVVSQALQNQHHRQELQQLGMLMSFSEQQLLHNERPPLDFQDYNSPALVSEHPIGFGSANNDLERSFSDSQLLDIHRRPIYVQDYYSSDSHHVNDLTRSCSDSQLVNIHRPIYVQDYSSDQVLFLQQMACDNRHQPAQVLADDNLSFQDELDKLRDSLLLDEENA